MAGSETSDAGELIGKRLGSYRIAALIGRGGMGAVYRAFDERLGRDVALKTVRPGEGRAATLAARLKREAAAAAALNHPGIATLLDCGEADGSLFVVYELLDGVTLRGLLGSRRPSVAESVAIARQVGSALGAAHDRGIIHRDIKPENVMLLAGTTVKVLDFGLATTAADASLPSAEPTGLRGVLTAEGAIVGTLPYMSPEQLEGRPVDARSDVWSLGALCYELLTGEPPFDRSDGAAAVAAILSSEPRALRSLNPDVPAELEAIVLRALRKNPAARFASGAELARALEQAERRLGEPGVAAAAGLGEPEYFLGRDAARLGLGAVQLVYLAMYLGAFVKAEPLAESLDALCGAAAERWSGPLLVLVLASALVGMGVRLYILSLAIFDHARTGVRYRRAFPFFFLLDELWALMPLTLAPHHALWLSLPFIPPLVFLPFSQRTLVRSAWASDRAART